ncbi:MAG: pantetheine-phosphate adenylyltransferase [Alphaproteobacteria bacterium]|nr:pantetheine-phosphate adenylyltransferase [Alphaproteobacteria bacterium]
MARIAVFPGSFDPVTRGHEDIVRRAVKLFDKIIVAVGENAAKKSLFTTEQRLSWLRSVFADEASVAVASYTGLTVDFCLKSSAGYILRGLRSVADFEFERGTGQMNKLMVPTIETVFLLCAPEFSALSSTIIRDIIRNGGDVTPFIPSGIVIAKP